MPASLPSLSSRIVANRLFDRLPADERKLVAARVHELDMDAGDILHEPGEPMREVYFPTSGMISLVERGRDGTMVEVGTAGADGMVGISVFLDVRDGSSEAMAQVPGSVLAMSADDFQTLLQQAPVLHRQMQRYTHLTLTVSARNAACNRLHTLVERAARWLLMTRDRVGSTEFPLTQEFFASMLGSHRPGVTVAAGGLKKAGVIRYRRGLIEIVDPEGLERLACECYAILRDAQHASEAQEGS
jgi:CRP-like cAMP-binding protein